MTILEKYLVWAYEWLEVAKECLKEKDFRECRKNIGRCESRISWIEEELKNVRL